MFFPERIKSIKPGDRVLEVGPGGSPHPRSDVLLEYDFGSEAVFEAQRGHTPGLTTQKPVVFFQGDRFPFADNEFDYVICSHVVEHVDDVDAFMAEVSRVGKAGYLEYPTVYYEYIYNLDVHVNFVKLREGKLHWMKKADTPLAFFEDVQRLFLDSLSKGYPGFNTDMQAIFFEGLEWNEALETLKVDSLSHVVTAAPLPQRAASEAEKMKLRWANAMNKVRRISSPLLKR